MYVCQLSIFLYVYVRLKAHKILFQIISYVYKKTDNAFSNISFVTSQTCLALFRVKRCAYNLTRTYRLNSNSLKSRDSFVKIFPYRNLMQTNLRTIVLQSVCQLIFFELWIEIIVIFLGVRLGRHNEYYLCIKSNYLSASSIIKQPPHSSAF